MLDHIGRVHAVQVGTTAPLIMTAGVVANGRAAWVALAVVVRRVDGAGRCGGALLRTRPALVGDA